MTTETRPVQALPTLTAAEILKRVEALGPLIEEEADTVVAQQRLTDRLKAALAEAGAFSIGFPTEGWNGPEMRLDDQVRMLESIAYHDASVAWNIQILADTGFFVTKLEDTAAREIFKDATCATAGSTRPAGRAVKVDGGYVLSGHWSFGSGIRNADAVYGGFYRYQDGASEPDMGPDGKPELHSCFVPIESVKLHDAWYTTGLSGSGSTEYSVDNVFVPENYMYSIFANDGDPAQPPLSRHAGVIVLNEAGVPLGIAQRAIDEFRKIVEKPTRTNQFESMKTQDPYVAAAYGEAVAYVDAARSYALKVGAELSDTLFSGGNLVPSQLGEVMQASYMAGVMSRHALEVLMECLGARSVLAATKFDRLYRDMSTLIRHTNHRRRALEMAGVWALDLPTPSHMVE